MSQAVPAIPPILIGYDLAETLDAKVGSTVMVISPQGELTPYGLEPKYQRFQVVGIFHSGFYQYDNGFAFIRLVDAQRLFGEPDIISVISFKVDDLYHADRIGREIEQAAGPGFLTTNWMEQNREIFRALALEQYVTFIVIALIVCVAALNILIALTMMVMEKTRDIAVLMSFGVRPEQIRRIFLFQGLLISVLGNHPRADHRLSGRLGRPPLPIHPARPPGLFAGLPAFRASDYRWGDRGAGLARSIPACNALPFFLRGASAAGRSSAV